MPKRHKGAPSDQDLYAPIAWRTGPGEYEEIRYETGGGIAKVTIDRPDVLNAFRPQTLIEVSAAMELAREDSEVGVVVFTGLAAYDTQAIRQAYAENAGTEANEKLAVMGALSLYLSFLNLFLTLLQLLGTRREE